MSPCVKEASLLRMRVFLAACLTISLAGCGAESSQMLRGTIAVSSCSFGAPFDVQNEQVRVLDESDKLIATGRTESNLLLGFRGLDDVAPRDSLGLGEPCVVTFSVSDLPRAEFYTVEVDGEKSEALSHADLVEAGFAPTIDLGDGVVVMTSSQEDFCEQMQRLEESLLDPESINKDRGEAWDDAITVAQEVAFDFQRERVLAGRTDADDPEMYRFARAIERMKYDHWYRIAELNRAADKVDPLARALLQKFDCKSSWSTLGYVNASSRP